MHAGDAAPATTQGKYCQGLRKNAARQSPALRRHAGAFRYRRYQNRMAFQAFGQVG